MYNSEKTILNALESVKNQTIGRECFEIIIINDGSVDRSEILVKKFINENPEMNINLINQPNKGVSSARNTGLKNAKGEYIALLDSDDEWLPEKTHQMMSIFESNQNIDFLATLRNNEKIGFPYNFNQYNLAEITLKKFLIRNIGQTSTVIFKQKIIKNTGLYDENQKFAEDSNYWLRIAENNKMYVLGQSLVNTGNGKKSFGESGLSANLLEMEKGFQKNLKELFINEKITKSEYFVFYLFFKIKYIIRILRTKI